MTSPATARRPERGDLVRVAFGYAKIDYYMYPVDADRLLVGITCDDTIGPVTSGVLFCVHREPELNSSGGALWYLAK